ncbi:MAG: hypothetical protein H6Q54_1828 [Deltaproteobacteria bacterium]|jgi:hypothetical protein|nr:hypothetical protein [Deltaproteobacteria bacterium]
MLFLCYTFIKGGMKPYLSEGGVDDMYFMNICTWSPEDEKEVERRRANWKWPKGVKVLCEFIDLQGCRVINVVDTDAKGLIASRETWIDLMLFETFPVYPFGASKDLLKK